MGALSGSVGRKRGGDYSSLRGIPSLYTSDWDTPIDDRISKKAKFSLIQQSPDRPVLLSKSSVSRIHLYPEAATPLRREVHAPCRILKPGLLSRSSRDCFRFDITSSSAGKREQERRNMGNALSARYDQVKNAAFDAMRYLKKDKEVIDLEAEEEEVKMEDVCDDSSIEEVEVLKDGRQGRATSSDHNNGAVINVEELDEKSLVGKSLPPSLASEVTELTSYRLKVENAEKRFDPTPLRSDLGIDSVPVHKTLMKSAERRNSKLSSLNFQIELEEKHRAYFSAQRSAKKPAKVVIPQEAFVPLTGEEEIEIARALSPAYRRKLLVTHQNSNIEITGEMLQCLRPGQWLNDEVINVYMELLKERETREPKKFLRCHFFNTFFYKKLISGKDGYDFKAVRRWTTQRKLGYSLTDCDKIFVPIHKEVHWCLAVINKKDQNFQYLDSLGGTDSQVLKKLARYFSDEVKDKSGNSVDVSTWEQEFVENLPEQQNGSDCGMFMIKYADFYSRGGGLCFNQEHMPYFRKRTAKEIMRLKAE